VLITPRFKSNGLVDAAKLTVFIMVFWSQIMQLY
jgi:hypothetical protein